MRRPTVLVNQGEFAKALRDLDQALEIDPKNSSALEMRPDFGA